MSESGAYNADMSRLAEAFREYKLEQELKAWWKVVQQKRGCRR